MGRSSNSSHYQLSTNKLISRIHVSAVYIASNPPAPKKVQVECKGWNGVKVHCQGKAWELMKGDTFTSETEDADIMVDVQDARVLLTWPKHENKISTPTDSDSAYSTWDSENSPQRNATAAARIRPLDTSPLRQQHRLQSPVSPSPAVQAVHAQPSGYFTSDPPIPVPVQVYEDEPSDEDKDKASAGNTQATQFTQVASQPFAVLEDSPNPNDFPDDNDEENDPIISSFGPYGANLGARMESFTTSASPHRQPLNPLKEASISPQRSSRAGFSPKRRRHNAHRDVSDSLHREDEAGDALMHHVINQLAYSRVQSTPLSSLMQNLPTALKDASLTDDALKLMLDRTHCIGSVEREGKDAAGKRLESEYYYIPEADADGSRREVVEGMGGRGLRNCRKSHKVGNYQSSHRSTVTDCICADERSNTTGGSPSSLSRLKCRYNTNPDQSIEGLHPRTVCISDAAFYRFVSFHFVSFLMSKVLRLRDTTFLFASTEPGYPTTVDLVISPCLPWIGV